MKILLRDCITTGSVITTRRWGSIRKLIRLG